MPLVYQQDINATTRLGVWHIREPEVFFSDMVPLQRAISHPHKRLQHLSGRYLLKELYPDFPYHLIRIADTRRPFLENEQYHFSISHCADFAAVVVSKTHRSGVDIEPVSEKAKRLSGKFILEADRILLPSVSPEAQSTLGWCVKEAVFKWFGSGGVDFRSDIRFAEHAGDGREGVLRCIFRNMTSLKVHYLFFNDTYLAWVITDH